MIEEDDTTASNEMQMLKAALWYASQGFHVFPCKRLSKIPATSHGFKDATVDEKLIKRWWAEDPYLNVAIATGDISGIIVLDVDPRNGGDWQALKYDPPNTIAVSTPGGGHLYYKAPKDSKIKCHKLGNESGLDVKANGGYVLAPPSAIKNEDYKGGACYEWIDLDDTPSLALWPFEGPKDHSMDNVVSITNSKSVIDVEEVRSALDSLDPDMGYEEWIEVLMAVHSEFPNDVGVELCDAWSANGSKYKSGEIEQKWRTFSNGGGKTINTLFKMANETGWRWNAPVADGPIKRAKKVPAPSELEADIEELMRANLTPRCIVDQIIFADVCVWAAAGGTGKTTIFLRMACEIVLGKDVFGYKNVNPGKVIFITAEDRREQCLARLRMLMEAHGFDKNSVKLVLNNLLIWDVSGEQRKLARVNDDNVLITSLSDDLVESFSGENIAMIAFDPLVSFGASESKVNDNEGALIVAGRRISRGLDCCVLYIHHTGKAQAREKVSDQYAGRGGSALSDGARMVVSINPWDVKDKLEPPAECNPSQDEELIYLTFAKSTYAKRPGRIWLKRRGWKFEQYNEMYRDPEEELEARMAQMERWLISQCNSGNYFTQREIEDGRIYEDFNMKREMFRKVMVRLKAAGRVIEPELPRELRHGARKTYLKVNDSNEPKF